jgi:hypothetical protein
MTDFRACSSETLAARRLEREACAKLNLTPSAYGGEYSANVVGEMTRWVREHGVSIPSQRERTLRVTGDGKIRMIKQIVGFRSKRNLHAFPQLEALLQRHIKLCETGPAQDIAASIAKLTPSGHCKRIRIKPA